MPAEPGADPIAGIRAEELLDVERVEGLERVRRRLAELAAACRTSLWAFQPDGPQSAERLQASRPLNEATLARGVQMRSVFLESLRNEDATREHVAWLTGHGAEVRTLPDLPTRLLLIDHEVAVLPLSPEDSGAGALIVTSPGVVATLDSLFLWCWSRAAPFQRGRPTRESLLNSQELEALRLWGQGYGDVTVARRLGVSVRTVRRISATVYEALGVASRFQAGVRAVELGLVMPAPAGAPAPPADG